MTRNAQDIIDDMRNIVKPRIAKMLFDVNFEGCGKEDKAEFETEFEMILTLAEMALPMLNKLKEKDEAKAVRYEGDGYADGAMVYDYAFCPNCEHEFEEDSENWKCDFCPNCGQRLRWEE